MGGILMSGKILVLAVLTAWAGLAGAGPARAAPGFPDVSQSWAADSVSALSARGLVEGYPDGNFKGDRAATRYEIAEIVSRLAARLEQQQAPLARRSEIDDLRRTLEKLRVETGNVDPRLAPVEGQVRSLQNRTR